MSEIARKHGCVCPDYEKRPLKLEDRAFCRTHLSTTPTVASTITYPHIVATRSCSKSYHLLNDDSHSAQLSNHSMSTEVGEAQAMATKHQCLSFKVKAMTEKGKSVSRIQGNRS